MLDNQITHLRCIDLSESPSCRILNKILAIGAGVKPIEKGRYGVDAGLKFLARKGHIETPAQRGIPCKEKIHIWSSCIFCKLQIILVVGKVATIDIEANQSNQ
ncbi:MAG: hypothetical protein II362_05880 [Alistipes sp.]|nr:hypothetical protein [Alistipes sp.]MBQ1939723.1 hypothetical protein [Alistipes sp.]MBQ2392721.1 hypothetical protein [Alistipes sp.]MBQ5638596.1 hypothetical protein [Alistipes sp.]MBQ5717852.1 hypothetical protein [Alistipes sp.]